MLQLLLKKNEFSQIKILRLILKDKEIKKSEVITTLDLNTATFSRYIRMINQDLAISCPNDTVRIQQENDYLTVLYPKKMTAHQILKSLSNYYLNHSSAYSVLQLLIKNPAQNINFFLDQTNVSQSYFNKLIKQINFYFKPCGVKITQRNKMVFLDGPQIKRIYLEFSLMTFFTKLGNDDFSDSLVTHPQLFLKASVYEPLTQNQIDNLGFLNQVFNHHLNQSDSITIPDTEVRCLLHLMDLKFNLVDQQPHLERFEADALLLFNLLLRTSPTTIDTQQKRRDIGRFFLELDHPITNDTKSLLAFMNQAFPPDNQSITTLEDIAYIVTLAIIHLRLFDTDLSKIFTINLDISLHADTEKRSQQRIALFLKNESSLSTLSSKTRQIIVTNLNLFTNASYTYIQSHLETKLAIHLDFLHHLDTKLFLKTRLLNVFSDERIIFVGSDESPDLVITDRIFDHHHTGDLFILSSQHANEDIDKLLTRLTLMINKKLVASFEEKMSLS